MKHLICLALMFAAVLISPTIIFASPAEENIRTLNDYISTEELEKNYDNLHEQYGEYMPSISFEEISEWSENGNPTSGWIEGIIKFLFHELLANGKLLGSLLFLTMFSALLNAIQSSFENTVVSKIAYMIIYIVLIGLALESFGQVIQFTTGTIEQMSSFMIGLLPLLLGIMASFSNLMSISFFHPIIVALVQSSGLLVKYLLIPLFASSALLMVVGSLNTAFKVDQLAELLRKSGMAIMGAYLTLFLGVISVQGTVTAVQDGVTMKTARFVTGNFVPVVGRLFTDATDTILGASLLLKNTVGLAGVVILLGIALFPAIKIFALALVYKFAAAILQPIGDGPIVSAMVIVSRHMMYIFAALLMVSMMFFLVIVILVAASNITMMVR
ncbi:stage III sporulation protein AE [Halobacillus massiliensis]|uniref:stage III sporulation protein AE n=1 Tax=Halobacillus massiliensis TaxID=1926286 RepID=UPI0009E3C4FB|nr:stage III sporulation protein AE [Halobacillus massiliensis]